MLFLLLTRRRVKGRGNVPEKGPLIIVANHLSLADPPLLGISLGRKVIFMAKEELFRSRLPGYFISNFGAFPVHRGKLDRQALGQADQVLANGLALIMFPEAQRSRHAQLQRALPGSALIVRRRDAPVLPVGITGTERIRGTAWMLRRPRITVNIGQPFYLPPVNSKPTRDKRAEDIDFIMRHVAELLPEEYRGCYGGKQVEKHED